jgi:hypothetical protein
MRRESPSGGPLACVVLALVATSFAGCQGRDAEDAEAVAQDYLEAAARGDAQRLCELRSRRALRRIGDDTCPSTLRYLAADAGPRRERLDAENAKVLSEDTTASEDTARVVIDVGRADVEGEHAVGGQVLEMDLRRESGDYKVDRVGLAVFAD